MANILVTGGAGFIGSHVVAELLKRGEEVRVVDDLSKGRINNFDSERVEFVPADVTDFNQALKLIEGMEFCFHFAAKIGGIGYFHKYPVESLRDNTLMTINILEAARREKRFEKFIYISSSMVFERTEKFPSKEDDIFFCPPPITHYGFSKLVGEYLCTAYQRQYGLKYAIFRPFNAYGPGEMPEDEVGIAHVIPDLVRKMLVERQNPLEVLGDGEQVRAYTYVTDIAEAIVNFGLDERSDNETFNIANPDSAITVKELARKIWEIGGNERELKFKHLPALEDDVRKRIPSIEKVQRVFGWSPKVELEEGLRRTMEWILGKEK